MFYRARQAVHRAWFDFNGRAVLETPPLATGDAPLTVASMLCHRDVIMYLLAIKSFVRNLGFSPSVVVLDDGSLTGEDMEILRRHVPSLRSVPLASIDRGSVPKGGAWEKLMMVGELVRDSYVIQIDSDTLTLGPIAEVNESIQLGRNFAMLGDRSYPHIETLLETSERSRQNFHPHVQALCERSFHLLPESANLKYVRGNAGLVGFAQGSIDREKIQWFSDLMRPIAGAKWNEWGSEQITANLLVANSPYAKPLGASEYITYWAHPEIAYDKAAFLHFVGPCRFSHGFYVQCAKRVIQDLKAS